MKTLRLIFSILIFGLLWIPQSFHATMPESTQQETHSESCALPSKKMENMSCCKTDSEKSDQSHDCNDQCQGNSCHCASVHASLSFYFDVLNIEIKTSSNFQKLAFYYQAPQLSTAFDNIWQPPKIS